LIDVKAGINRGGGGGLRYPIKFARIL